MSVEQIANAALGLPLAERVALAEALWASIDGALTASEEGREAIDRARRRDKEMTSGTVKGRTHQQIMKSARRKIR